MEKDSTERCVSRQDLYDRVWATPMRRSAAEFSISDVGLFEALSQERNTDAAPRLLDDARGAATRAPAAPPASRDGGGGLRHRPRYRGDQLRNRAPQGFRAARGDPPRRACESSSTGSTDRALAPNREARLGRPMAPRAPRALPVRIGPDNVDRGARILDALLKCIEKRGHRLTVKDKGGAAVMAVAVAGEEIVLAFGEQVTRERRELTEAEKRRQEPLYNSFPSGRLFLREIDHYCPGLRKHWADGRRQRLETCLGTFILQLERVAAWVKKDRQERGEAEKKRRASELKRAEKLRAIQEEEQRLEALRAHVDAWHQSERLRRFANAVHDAARESG